MAITLRNTVNNAVIEMPFDLQWDDEFNYSPVQQTVTFSITGAMLVEESTKQAGRPITLSGKTDGTWLSRADVMILQGWASTPNLVMQLGIRGGFKTVIFHHENGSALEGLQAYFIHDGALRPNTFYHISIKFLEL